MVHCVAAISRLIQYSHPLTNSHPGAERMDGAAAHSPPGGPVYGRVPPDRLAEILNVAEDGIVTVDARQRIVLFNRGASKIFGYAPDEVLGRPLDTLIPAVFHAAHRGQVDEFAGGQVVSRLMGERR